MAVRKPLPERDPRPKSLGADVAYTAEQIQVLEGREHVRRRPSMYIGSTSTTGLHHLVYGGVDNAVDEALAGYARRIVLTLFPDGRVQVHDDGRGIPFGIHKKHGPYRPGTIVRLGLAPQIFPDAKFDREVILHRLREMAYLNKRLEIALADESLGHSDTFYFEGGIVPFVRALNRDEAVVNVPPFYVDREIEGTQVEVALQDNETFIENVIAFANTIHTTEGGTHLTGFRSELPNG